MSAHKGYWHCGVAAPSLVFLLRATPLSALEWGEWKSEFKEVVPTKENVGRLENCSKNKFSKDFESRAVLGDAKV